MPVTLTSERYNALLANCADDAVRYCLNGFCLDFDAGMAIATDGYAIITIPIAEPELRLTGQVILGPHTGKLKRAPKGGTAVIDTSCDTVTFFTSQGLQRDVILLLRIDDKYPDYTKVIPEMNGKKAPSVLPAINPRLISRTTEALRADFVQFAFPANPSKASPFLVQIHKHDDIRCVVMPARRW